MVTQDPVARLKKLIGFSDEPVPDNEGFWTIGYGQRLNDKPGGPKPYATMSEPFADEMLRYSFEQDPGQFGSFTNSPFAADGSPEIQDPPNDTPAEPEKPSGFQKYLAGMSRADLYKLKDALNNISNATQIFSIAIGSLVLVLNPGTLTVTVFGLGFGAIIVGASWLADEIDKRLDAR